MDVWIANSIISSYCTSIWLGVALDGSRGVPTGNAFPTFSAVSSRDAFVALSIPSLSSLVDALIVSASISTSLQLSIVLWPAVIMGALMFDSSMSAPPSVMDVSEILLWRLGWTLFLTLDLSSLSRLSLALSVFASNVFMLLVRVPILPGWGAAFRILRLVPGSCCSNTSYACISCFAGGYSLSLAPVLVTAQESKFADVALTARPSHRFIRIHLFFGSPVSLFFPVVIKF